MSRPKPPIGRRFTSETGRAAAQKQRLPEPTHPISVRLYTRQVDQLRALHGGVSSALFRELVDAYLQAQQPSSEEAGSDT